MTVSAPATQSNAQTAEQSDAQLNAASETVWPDACLLGVALIWGVNIPIMKIGLGNIDSFVFNAVRLCVSALVLAGFAFAEHRRGIRPDPDITWRQILCYGLLVSGLYQLLFLLGIDRTTSGNTALIISTVPMWTALLARVFLCERLPMLAWGGLLVALAGTVIVALQKGDVTADRQHLVGNLIVLAAAMAWSAGTVYSRRLLKSISPMQLSATGAVIALPVHLLMASGNFVDSLPELSSLSLWLIILYAGVLSSGLALPMWNFGVRHAGAAHAAIIQNLIPLVAIVAAWLIRGEDVTVPQVVGGGLILSGLVIMRVSRQRQLTRNDRGHSASPENQEAAGDDV